MLLNGAQFPAKAVVGHVTYVTFVENKDDAGLLLGLTSTCIINDCVWFIERLRSITGPFPTE